MPSPIPDKLRKKVIAEYVECGNYSAVARKFKLSVNGVKKIVQGDTDCAAQCEQKKKENTVAVLAHMDARKKDVCEIIDILLAAIRDPDKIAAAPLNQIATAMGIIIDKYTANEITLPGSKSSSLAGTIMAAYERRKENGEV